MWPERCRASLHGLPPEVRGGTVLDIRLALPLHSAIKTEGLRPLMIFPLSYKGGDLQVQVHETNLGGMTVYFIGGEPIATSGSVYSLDFGVGRREIYFLLFGRVGVDAPFGLEAQHRPRQ